MGEKWVNFHLGPELVPGFVFFRNAGLLATRKAVEIPHLL
jgi:hypothetical protein